LQNENETAITYLNHFARLMRLTLENSKDKYITLEKETESLTQYLELEKLRFDHAFDYKITQTENAEEDMTIPSMLLQPLVENAIIHGIVPRNSKGNIHIHFDTQNNQIAIKITDTGIGYNFSKKLKKNSVLSHKSMALEIVKNRIEMLGGTFSINEITENNIILGTEIKILI
jgi:LytS/YehU family sensor histidine kinase